MSTDIELSKIQFSNIIQSGRLLGNMISNLGKKALKVLAVLLAKDVFPKLVTKADSFVIDKFGRKISG